jgi:hypothetical protein
MTARTGSSGRPSAASAILKRMFSFPVTRLNALISSLVTSLSARALIRCTVAISNSTIVSVISRSRSQTSAANSSTVSSRGRVRM